MLGQLPSDFAERPPPFRSKAIATLPPRRSSPEEEKLEERELVAESCGRWRLLLGLLHQSCSEWQAPIHAR